MPLGMRMLACMSVHRGGSQRAQVKDSTGRQHTPCAVRTLLIESSRRVGVRLEVRDGEGMRRGHDGDEEQHVESPHLSLQLGSLLVSGLFPIVCCCFA